MDKGQQPVSQASELGEFAYCRCAWWLGRVCGLPSTNRAALAHGRALHERHGRQAQRATWLGSAATWAFWLALILVAIGILLSFAA